MVILVNYGFGGSVMTVTNAKSSAESSKFTLKIRSESGKLFIIGCHFPPKSTNFGTLSAKSNNTQNNILSMIGLCSGVTQWQIQLPDLGGGGNLVQGTPKAENSTDLTHCFLGWAKIHF